MKLFKILIIALLLPIISVANNGKKTGKYTKTKEIHKEFTVRPNTEFIMENLYGNVDIIAWDGDKIIIDSQIIVNGEVEQSVNSALKKIFITFVEDKKKNTLNVLTKGTGDIKEHREVHFQIKIPRTNPLNIYNQYGNISIDETNANASLLTNYGNLIAGKLNGQSTKLFFGYSQSSTIDYIKNGYIWGSFSDYKIGDAEELFLENMHSSNGKINNVKRLKFEDCSYGTLTIDNVSESINGKGEYLTTIVNNSSGNSLNIKSKYGTIDIKKWSNKSAHFEVSQTKLSLGYFENTPFNMDLNVNSCANFVNSTISSLPVEIKQNITDLNNKKRKFSSYYITKNNSRKLTINMTKGILRFNKVENPIAIK